MDIALIGHGAIAGYVAGQIEADNDITLTHVITRPGRQAAAVEALGTSGLSAVATVDEVAPSVSVVVDCAGHGGLIAHGEAALRAGFDVLTVSIGALTDAELARRLDLAASEGRSQLHLASGAIGALDALAGAAVGGLESVVYRGRKPPQGWLGSVAEEVLDLGDPETFGTEPRCHFRGDAAEAARRYPKNANVAAAVALAGAGFDATEVELWADPSIDRNIHEVEARGAFGRFRFEIEGDTLPGNPKSSALAAMSVVAHVRRLAATKPGRAGNDE